MLSGVWRFCFRLLYNEFAFSYDCVSRAVSLGHWRAWQRCALTCLPDQLDGPVLELAHGTGDLQLDLQAAGFSSIALDLSPFMGQLARRKLQKAGASADLVRGDAFRLPFCENAFSAVVCTFPTSFICQLPVLVELQRIAKPGSLVIIVLVGQLRNRSPLSWLIDLLYQLTDQGNTILDDSAVRELFNGSHFDIKTKVLALDGSVAQLAILTAPPCVTRETV